MSHLTHAALCNSIGGFALAAKRAGIPAAWTCDIDPFCNAISRKQFPKAHQYQDYSFNLSPTTKPV